MPQTKFARCYLHHYRNSRTRVKTIGPFRYMLPYASGDPADNLLIVQYGLVTDNYAVLDSDIHEFSYTGSWLVRANFDSYSYACFQNYFPDFRSIGNYSELDIISNQGTSNDWLVLENVENGRVLANQVNVGGTDKYYNSLADFESDTNGAGASSIPDIMTTWSSANGSGANRGSVYGIAYTSVDELDNPNNFLIYYFQGPTSTQNNIRLGQANTATGTNKTVLAFFFQDAKPLYPTPYSEIPESSEGGGDGEGAEGSEPNPLDAIPTTSFADAGFCRIYNPKLGELRSLSQYMWTDTTFLQTVVNHLKQLLENPMDAIISLSLVPCSIPNGQSEEVKVMYIPTGVYMHPALKQFIEVDCGSVKINKNIGCALDYNPYTKIHVYLPYIGQVTLNTDEVMGKTLHLIYRIDIVTGICSAHILVNENVMYVFSGHCSVSQPLASADFSSYLNAMITAAKSVAAVAAGAGGAPGVAAGLIGGPAPRTSRSQESGSESKTVRNPNTGRQITLGTESYSYDVTRTSSGASFGELATRAASNTVSNVINSKLIVEHTNGFGGNSGYISQRTPFIIIERARLCNPKEYGNYNGYPSMIYLNLGEISGYTEVQQIQLTGINATNPELSEMSELLKSGVIL